MRRCLCLANEYPEALKSLPRCDKTEKPKDILPDIDKVHFETFGDDVVAKVNGKNMWFVHEVTFRGLKPLLGGQKKVSLKKTKAKAKAVNCYAVDISTTSAEGESFAVDISKNTESVVEINMGSIHTSSDTVNVRVKTHFQDSRYLKPQDVPARNTVRNTPFH